MPCLILLLALIGTTHPIHSSSAILELDPGGRLVRVTIRVFAEDFPPGLRPEAIDEYLGQRFTLADNALAAMPLQLKRVRSEGAVLVLDLTAPAPRGLTGTRVWHGVLSERFSDQVNIVQARHAGRSTSLLFTATDGPKALP